MSLAGLFGAVPDKIFGGNDTPGWHYDPSALPDIYSLMYSRMIEAREDAHKRGTSQWRDIMDLARQAQKDIKAGRGQAFQDAKRAYGQNQAKSTQSAVSRGIGNTSVLDDMKRANTERYADTRGRLRQQFAAQDAAMNQYLAQVRGMKPIFTKRPELAALKDMALTGNLFGPPPGWKEGGWQDLLGGIGGVAGFAMGGPVGGAVGSFGGRQIGGAIDG